MKDKHEIKERLKAFEEVKGKCETALGKGKYEIIDWLFTKIEELKYILEK